MEGRYSDLHNVEDFIDHKMVSLISQFKALGRADMANTLHSALLAYRQGLCEIQFIGGFPYVISQYTNELSGSVD